MELTIEEKDRLLNIFAKLTMDEDAVPYVRIEDGEDCSFAVDSLIHITTEEAELLKKWGIKNLI